MDAVKYVKEQYRMCHSEYGCEHCPLNDSKPEFPGDCASWRYKNAEKAVELVEKWSAEHPRKTMMQDFFEKFPKAPKNREGAPCDCPYYCGYCRDTCCEDDDGNEMTCLECWSRPLEE